MNYYIADLHFGHSNILAFDGRPFWDIEDHDEALIANWNSVVTPRDQVYILGDFAFRNEKPVSYYVERLNGSLHLIRGNHDKHKPEYENSFSSVHDMLRLGDTLDGEHRKVTLCHYWMPFIGRSEIMLYGHTHVGDEFVLEVLLQDELKRNGYPMNAYNVGCMHLRYFPRTLQQIVHGI